MNNTPKEDDTIKSLESTPLAKLIEQYNQKLIEVYAKVEETQDSLIDGTYPDGYWRGYYLGCSSILVDIVNDLEKLK